MRLKVGQEHASIYIWHLNYMSRHFLCCTYFYVVCIILYCRSHGCYIFTCTIVIHTHTCILKSEIYVELRDFSSSVNHVIYHPFGGWFWPTSEGQNNHQLVIKTPDVHISFPNHIYLVFLSVFWSFYLDRFENKAQGYEPIKMQDFRP